MRQKEHGHAVPVSLRQVESLAFALGTEERLGDLQQDAGPVAGRLIGAGRPAVHHIGQHLPTMLDNRMVALARDIHHRPDATRVVFELRVVEPVGFCCSVDHCGGSKVDLPVAICTVILQLARLMSIAP